MPTNATLYLLQSCRLHNVDKYVQFRRTDVVGAQSFCPRGSHVAHDHTSDDHTSDDRTSDDHTSDDHSSDDHASHDHASDDHTSDDHTSDDHASHDRVIFLCTQLSIMVLCAMQRGSPRRHGAVFPLRNLDSCGVCR